MIKTRRFTGFKSFSDADVAAIAFMFSIAAHISMLVYAGGFIDLSFLEKNIPQTQVIKFKEKKAELLPEIRVVGQVNQIIPYDAQEDLDRQEIPADGAGLAGPQKDKIDAEKTKAEEAMLRYQDMIKQKIEQNRKYPLYARQRKIQGITDLKFGINRLGGCTQINIIRSSQSEMLDKEAVDTIKRSEPFPIFPSEIRPDQITVNVAIVFSLK
jgi:TonB family protein